MRPREKVKGTNDAGQCGAKQVERENGHVAAKVLIQRSISAVAYYQFHAICACLTDQSSVSSQALFPPFSDAERAIARAAAKDTRDRARRCPRGRKRDERRGSLVRRSPSALVPRAVAAYCRSLYLYAVLQFDNDNAMAPSRRLCRDRAERVAVTPAIYRVNIQLSPRNSLPVSAVKR